MKLHDLHVFMAVMQAASMSKAAKLLNTGQPAISRSIANLEHALGVRLLDRSRQGVKPTEFGQALLNSGTTVFDDLRQAAKNIAFLADPTVGQVRIGCAPFLAATVVTAVINRLSSQYPAVSFFIVTGDETILLQELTARNVDLLVTWRSGPIVDEDLDYQLLYEDTYSIAVSARNPLARRRKIKLADLLHERWVLPPEGGATELVIADGFRAIGLGPPKTKVIVDPAEARMSLVATGRFVAVFPNSVLRFYHRRADLKILPVTPPLASRASAGLATLKGRAISPTARLFQETCLEISQDLEKR
jgi:DNA-binding transcriptional LysR family regulator